MRVLGKHSRGGNREDAYGMFGAVNAFKNMRQTGISLRLDLGPNPDYRDIAKWARTLTDAELTPAQAEAITSYGSTRSLVHPFVTARRTSP